MNDEMLESLLKPFIIDLQGNILSTSACIEKHLDLLLTLRAQRVRLADIVRISGTSYSCNSFSRKLSLFKKTSSRPTEVELSKKEIKQPPATLNKNEKAKNEKNDLQYPIEEWVAATRLSKHSKYIFAGGEKRGLIPSDFNGFTNYNNLHIINVFTGWTDLVDNTLIDSSKIPTKENYLLEFKDKK
ncbi:hypothetical protein TUM4438_41370 [Shewanella sairae]|uniref:Uncharacterized protein n=1 Tax=Shewanella sairae TaxID=190310 RepID=A0ABQ4PQL9_9GAMM|nr:hypothetical protein [Shewanella sairae]MCL1132341.1 hypothetical protein [Shewanella sairae]GIU51506.1 hypothetical protein TUM4438_41370 [Shewanella sairae]